MGAGAGVLAGNPLGREFRSDLGYVVDFPQNHWVWHNSSSSGTMSTTVPSDDEDDGGHAGEFVVGN